MQQFTKLISSVVLISFFCASCVQSEYSRLVKAELEKGVRQDSLIFGMKFGDTENTFFGKCYDLNHDSLITQGPTGKSVQYLFIDSLVHKKPTRMRMLFYPSFDGEGKIAEMKMEFSYQGWAPWNRELQSDSLKNKTLLLLSKWYGGNPFISVRIKNLDVPIKVDGNRRVMVDIKDAQSVRVMVQDLLHPMFRHSITTSADNEKGKEGE